MILRSIQVRGWRRFRNGISIGPFGDGITVLHAPNGTGKSSLFEALQRGLVDGHRTGGADALRLRPWDTDLDPQVTIEFVHADAEWRIVKRFLTGAMSELSRREGGTWVRVAEADAADEQVRGMLLATQPGRGLSRAEHWGIAQVLWAPQGASGPGRLTGDVDSQVRELLDAEVSGGAHGSEVEDRIQARWALQFTATGRPRKDARVGELRAELDVAESELAAARETHRAFEAAQRTVRELTEDAATHDADRANQRTARDTLRAVATEFADLRTRRAEQALLVETTTAQYTALQSAVDRRTNLHAELETAEQQLRDADERLPLLVRDRAAADVELAAATTAADAARTARDAARSARLEAVHARQFLTAHAQHADLQRRADQARQLDERAAELRAQRAQLVAPTSTDIDALRAAHRELEHARAQLDAALVTLEITPERDIDIAVSGLDTEHAAAGTPWRTQGDGAVEVQLPGFGTISARGPRSDSNELASRIAELETTLASCTTRFGTTDADVLADRLHAARSIDETLATIAKQLAEATDTRGRAALDLDAAQLAQQLETIAAAHPAWLEALPDADALSAQLDERADSAQHELELREAHRTTVAGTIERLATEHATATTAADALRAAVRGLRAQLETLRSAGDDDSVLRQLAVAVHAAQGSLEQLDQTLADERFADDPSTRSARAEAALERLDDVRERTQQQLAAATNEVGRHAATGSYSRIAECEERVAHLRASLARESLRTDAIAALHDTLAACHADVLEQFAAPVRRHTERILDRIADWGHVGTLQLEDGFVPAGFLPAARGSDAAALVALDQLSGGEREQVHLAVRLALAETLARDERQLVVFDDALVYTDRRRFERTLGILEEAAQRLQVVILTLDPSRYAGLTDAQFIDLQQELRDSLVEA